MSRGMGKIEKAVLDVLKEGGDTLSLTLMTSLVVRKIRPEQKYYTEAEYKSVCRAVRSLKKKGLLDTIRKGDPEGALLGKLTFILGYNGDEE